MAAATVLTICCLQPAGATGLTTRSVYISELRASAEKGNAEAQHELGNNYLVGAGVRRDNTEAVKWYRRAAEQGNAKAQAALGMMYSKGAGIARDSAEALKWWIQAAQQHNADALDQIGFAYLLGDGVPRNYTEAYKWFHLAAINGDKHAERDRESVSRFMVEDQINEARKRSEEWMEKYPKAGASSQISTKM